MKSLPSLFLVSILLLIGCGTDANDVVLNQEEPKSKLISATKMADISVSELEQSFDFVFPSNATTVYQAMKTDGATNINLLLKDGQNHADAALEFAMQVPLIFEELR